MPKPELTSEIIIPKAGERFAFHVFTPALQYRIKNPECNMPVMALRSSRADYAEMRLYHKIEVLGPSSLEPMFDDPLPGTAGRGVAIMFTESPMRVWFPKKQSPRKIKTPDNRNPEAILLEVQRKYVGNLVNA